MNFESDCPISTKSILESHTIGCWGGHSGNLLGETGTHVMFHSSSRIHPSMTRKRTSSL